MISRRFFAAGLAGLFGSAVSGQAQAGSILNLFNDPRPIIILEENRTLPPTVRKRKFKSKPKRTKRAASAKRQKKSKSFKINPIYEPQEVSFNSGYAPGTIVVNSTEKFLYLIQANGKARRYGVAIGKEGLGWTGTAVIRSKVKWPSWTPTAEMIERSPDHYERYKDGMPGGAGNPLGARAMYLYQGKSDTHIRIHGTTQPWSIGKAASNGCFRMVNEHVIDLYSRVKTGTKVVVL
jgi:lipoprotein-anchoring transpeptidase ErfK/SrfK